MEDELFAAKYGKILIDEDVIATYAGSVAVEFILLRHGKFLRCDEVEGRVVILGCKEFVLHCSLLQIGLYGSLEIFCSVHI